MTGLPENLARRDDDAGTVTATPLLLPGDGPAVHRIREAGRVGGQVSVLFVCDHASNAIPMRLDHLGLTTADRERHIAFDPGAAPVTEYLARRFGAPALMAGFSRLVIDPNRALDQAGLVPLESDGTVIPGNRNLSTAEIRARIEALWQPYHDAIEETLAEMAGSGDIPVLISIHSFTPELRAGPDAERPWQVSVLWNRDDRLARPLIRALAAAGLIVGDNEPYSGFEGLTHTNDIHALIRGYPHVELEIRQDVIADAAGQAAYATLIGDALAPLLAEPELRRIAVV